MSSGSLLASLEEKTAVIAALQRHVDVLINDARQMAPDSEHLQEVAQIIELWAAGGVDYSEIEKPLRQWWEDHYGKGD